MENTLTLLLQDTNAEWFSAGSGIPEGPLSPKDIVDRVQSGKFNLATHLWKEGMTGWQRLYEISKFRSLLPPEPSPDLISQIQEKTKKVTPPPIPSKPKDEPRIWYVYLEETQYGPFSDTEIQSLMDASRVTAETYVWKKGFADWELAEKMSFFGKRADAPVAAPKLPADKRGAPRKPFEARIILTDGREVGWAICRDISIGGMQLLMDHMPGEVGAVLKMNVTSNMTNIPSFAVEGTIVRVLDDGRGFSFRFQNLPDDAKTAITKYIQQ